MHYLTRMVNVFLPGYLMPPRIRPRARRRFKQGAGRLMRPALRTPYAPGRSLSLLPEAPPPAGSGWAAASPGIAASLGRAAAAFEAGGARSLSPAVRELVLRRLDRWRGEEAGTDTAWCDELVAGLPAHDRAAGRLALLTAFASHRTSEADIAAFRSDSPGDAALIEATAWASFRAARLIGERQAERTR
jgi:hypothetical protein